jgi:hypothetical protein
MSAPRLAAWIFGVAVCTAWLASAAGVGRSRTAPRPLPRPAMDAQLTALAADVETQAARLRDRLEQAPAPSPQQRNPFSFASRPVPVRPQARPSVIPPELPAPPPPSEPTLILLGVAEMPGADGLVRTAMVTTGAGDLIMVTAGQSLLGRYEVAAVAMDAVQLKEITTGSLRTLVLR